MPNKADQQAQELEHAVGRAICVFPNGETRRLYATELCPGGAFILAMRPPPVGSTLTVTIYPLARPPLPPLEARVIGLRIDPEDAQRTGFEVVFMHINDETLAKLVELAQVVQNFDEQAPPRRRPRRHLAGELRLAPRVATNLLAVVQMADEPDRPMRVFNLSMAGALIGTPPELETSRVAIAPGTKLQLTIVHSDAPESINLRAEVVRLTGPEEPTGFGVRFIGLEGADALRLEGLLLDCLVKRPGIREASG